MKNYILILFTLFYTTLFSQQIQVKDNDSQSGIPGVILRSGDKNSATNEKGEVDISIFTDSDTIDFVHPSYQITRHTAAYIKARKNEENMVTKFIDEKKEKTNNDEKVFLLPFTLDNLFYQG